MQINAYRSHVEIILEAFESEEREQIDDQRCIDCCESKLLATVCHALHNIPKICF